MAKDPNSPVPDKQTKSLMSAGPNVTRASDHLAALRDPRLNERQLTISEEVQAAIATCKLSRMEFERIYSPIHAELERVSVEFTRMFAARSASFASVTENIAKHFAAFAKKIEPFLEERRIRERIMEFGFVPHAVLFKYLGNVEKPSDLTIGELSQELANQVWPKIRPSLQLSQEDCLGDPSIYHTFDQIIRAHNAGLYQLTAPGAFHVIERAARLAQPGPQRKKTYDWLKSGLADMTYYDVPSQWRRGWIGVWAVLYEQAFCDCRTDDSADTFAFPHRHAAAHGFGAKISSSLDSINSVLLCHFVITSAAAFARFASSELEAPH